MPGKPSFKDLLNTKENDYRHLLFLKDPYVAYATFLNNLDLNGQNVYS